MIPDNTSDILLFALKKGGGALMKHLGHTDKVIVMESISSVVTKADLALEKAILKVLQSTVNPFNFNILEKNTL